MNTMRSMCIAALGFLLMAAAPRTALRGQSCDDHGRACVHPCVNECQPPPQTCTILVPQVVTEHRTMTVTRYRQETRERIVQTYRDVPVTKNVEEEYTVMVPQTRTRTVEDVINHPAIHDIGLRKTKMIPVVEARQTKRTVCRLEPFQEERTVCESVNTCVPGSSQPANGPADSNLPPPPPSTTDVQTPPRLSIKLASLSTTASQDESCSQKVCDSCPTQIQRKINVTVMKPVSEVETIDYPVTSFKSDSLMQTVSYHLFDPEKVMREEQYTVQVPEKRTRTKQITVSERVPEQRREEYTVTVPYLEQVQVPVKTVRYVPKTITEPIAPPCRSCDNY